MGWTPVRAGGVGARVVFLFGGPAVRMGIERFMPCRWVNRMRSGRGCPHLGTLEPDLPRSIPSGDRASGPGPQRCPPVEPNVVLPFLCSTLSFVFALFLLDQWLERRRSYQLIWTIGMLWYGISAGTEFWGGAFGWSEPLYRIWYLIGAVYVRRGWASARCTCWARPASATARRSACLLAGLFTYSPRPRHSTPTRGHPPCTPCSRSSRRSASRSRPTARTGAGRGLRAP